MGDIILKNKDGISTTYEDITYIIAPNDEGGSDYYYKSQDEKEITIEAQARRITPDDGYGAMRVVKVTPISGSCTPGHQESLPENYTLTITPTSVNTSGYIPSGTVSGTPFTVTPNDLWLTDFTAYTRQSISGYGLHLGLYEGTFLSANQFVNIYPSDLGLTAKAAETFTPTTTDQTIAVGQYLAGVQTIKGDANLIAENIKKDVRLFGILGTHEGGSTPTGTLDIAQNGTYDVTNYASASVNLMLEAYMLTATAGVFTNDMLKLSSLPYGFFAVKTSSSGIIGNSSSTLYIDASSTLGVTGYLSCIGVDFDTNTVRFKGLFTEEGSDVEATAEAAFDRENGTLTVTSATYNGTDMSSYISMFDVKLIFVAAGSSLYNVDPA